MTQADFDLLHDFVADRIAAEAFPRLESLLRASGDARRALRGLMAVEEGLEEMAAVALTTRYFGPPASRQQPQAGSRAANRRTLGDAFAAMVGAIVAPATLRRVGLPLMMIVACGLVGTIAARAIWPAARPRLPAGVLAKVVTLSDVAWSADSQPRHEGDGLQAGGSFAVAQGLVEIVFACGATVVLEGPATFEVIDGGAGKLDRGRLTATLDQPSGPFAIHTPTVVVTDRGTQFGVEVDPSGKTDVRVFQGLVELVALASLGTAEPLRLSAGHAGEVDAAGRISRIDAPTSKKFVMSVPKPLKLPPKPPLPFVWDAARAVTLYRDSFAGSGPLAGTAASARGGVGDEKWVAPQDGWLLDPETKSLKVKATGAAFLPFRPEPGHLYRLSVSMHVTEGGIGWAGLGFAVAANTRLATLDHAWMIQRHETKTQANAAYKGPQMAGQITRGDHLAGEQTRTVVLDTTGPRWEAFFLAGDEVVGRCSYDVPPDPIAHVAISVFPNTVVSFRDFSLRAIRANR
jgi:hypothetical protein